MCGIGISRKLSKNGILLPLHLPQEQTDGADGDEDCIP